MEPFHQPALIRTPLLLSPSQGGGALTPPPGRMQTKRRRLEQQGGCGRRGNWECQRVNGWSRKFSLLMVRGGVQSYKKKQPWCREEAPPPRQRAVIGWKKINVSGGKKGGNGSLFLQHQKKSSKGHLRSLACYMAAAALSLSPPPPPPLELKPPLLVLVSWGAAPHLRVGPALRRAVGRDAHV